MKKTRKRIISLVMAFVMVFSLFVGTGNLSASSDSKGEKGADADSLLGATPTDAEEVEEGTTEETKTGFVTFVKKKPEGSNEACNMAGIQYGIYRDSDCTDLVETIVLSYDGHVYREGSTDKIYKNKDDRKFEDSEISNKELKLELPVSSYYYKEKTDLKDSSLNFSTTGYEPSSYIGSFTVENTDSVLNVTLGGEWDVIPAATPSDAEDTTENTSEDATTEKETVEVKTEDITAEDITADTTEATTEPVIDTSSEVSTEDFTEATTEVATPGDIEGDTEEDTDRVLKFAVSTFSLVPMMMARVSLFASSATNYVRRTTTSFLTPQMILQDSNGKDVRSVYCGDHNKNAANYYKSGTKGDPVTLNTYGLNSSNPLNNVGNANVVKTLYYGYKNGLSFTALRQNLDYYRHGTANGNKEPAFDVSNLSGPTNKYNADITMQTVDAGNGTLKNTTSGSAKIKEIGVDDLRYKTVYTISKNMDADGGVKKLATKYYTGTGHKINGLSKDKIYNRTNIYKVNSKKNSYTIKVPKKTTCFTTTGEAEKGVNSCTWTSHAADTSVTLSGGTYFMFVALQSYKGKSSVDANASKDGFVAYVANPTNSSIQTLFAAELYEYKISLDIDWETEDTEKPGSGKFELNKVASDGSTSWNYNYYNMAGIQYAFYSDAKATKLVASSNHTRGDGIPVKAATQIVLSYNGKAYMDVNGYNVVFVSPAAKASFEASNELYTFRWYQDGLTADTSYYYKEVATTAPVAANVCYYYYNDTNNSFLSSISKIAGQDISVTGFTLDQTAHLFTFKKDEKGNMSSVKVTTPDNKVPGGSISLQKFVNNVKGSAAEGIVFKLYYVEANGNTEAADGSHKVGEFSIDGNGNGIVSEIETWASNRGVVASADGTQFTNLPLGWYYIYEMGSSVDQLGFVNDINQRKQWGELTRTTPNGHITFTFNNTTDGKAKATKQNINGYLDANTPIYGSQADLNGIPFYLYKVDSNGADYNSGTLIGTFKHNGSYVEPVSIDTDKIPVQIGQGSDAGYFTNLPYGWYCLVEDNGVASSRGFSTSEPVYLCADKYNKVLDFSMSDVRSKLGLKKKFENTDMANAGLCNYSLEGATYTVYTTTGENVENSDPNNYLGTFTTDIYGDGYVTEVNSIKGITSGDQVNGKNYKMYGVPLNTWLCIKETNPSPGCTLDETVHYLYYTQDNNQVYYGLDKTCESTEGLRNDPISISIKKEDSTSGSNSGAASLAGAEFTVSYYDVPVSGPDAVTKYSDLAGKTPVRKWVFTTDENGNTNMKETDKYLVKTKSDDLFKNSNGNPVFPYGAITIEESKAPDGYTKAGSFMTSDGTQKSESDGKIFAIINEQYTFEQYVGTNSLIKKEVSLRGDIKFKKVGLDTGKPLSGIAFKITSKTTGESHIVVTDENGMIDTSKIKHTENTNAADTDNKTVCGTWFYGNKDNTGTIDDTLGALPFDTYEITEVSTDINEKYRLITPMIVDLTDEAAYTDGYLLYDLNTVTNIPEPYIGTRALGVKTQDNIIPANEKVDVDDISDYHFLEAGKTYTMKGVIKDPETGKAYKQPDGTYSLGHKVFTTDSDDTGYVSAEVRTPLVLDTTGLDGKNVVVAEYLFEGSDDTDLTINADGTVDETGVYQTHTGRLVKHDDLTSKSQTLSVPKIWTTALGIDTGTHYLLASGIIRFFDKVHYENVKPGLTYPLTADVMNEETGEPILDVDGNKVTATAEFTPTEANGTAYVYFTCDASKVDFRDKATVIYEELSYNKITLAVHKDLNDKNQQLFFPSVTSSFVNTATGEHKSLYGKNMKQDDTVNLTKLPVGEKITVVDELHNKDTGKILSVEGKEVKESREVDVTNESMSLIFSHSFDGTKADLINKNGNLSDIVAFVYVYDANGHLIASEEDLTNTEQTIYLYTEKTDIKVVKEWDDNDNQDQIRPENVVVQLYKVVDGKKIAVGKKVELSENNDWSYTWKNLETQDQGEDIDYTVEEINVPDGYEATVTSDGLYSFIIKNYHKPGTTVVKVTKIWEDNNDKYQTRPKNIEVQLYKGEGENKEKVGDPVTLDKSMDWKYSWSNLDKQEDGKDIIYTVDEVKVPEGYTKTVTKDKDSDVTSFIIKNSMPDKKIIKTGDVFKMIPVLILMGASLVAIVILLLKRRKRK